MPPRALAGRRWPAASPAAAGPAAAGGLARPGVRSRDRQARVNFTGAERTAITVNGSLPAPLLHWREGDTVTMRVRNTLDETASIHWHGLVLPANMDGVPGLSFDGIPAGGSYTYRFPVKQAGTYWYHSHSGFQEQQGLYGPIVIHPREPDPIVVRPGARAAAHRLDRRGPAAHLPQVEEGIGLLQLASADARRPRARPSRQGLVRDHGRSPGVGPDAHECGRPGRRHRLHLHLPAERHGAGRQLDRPVHARRARPPARHQRLGDVVLRRADSRPEADGRGGRRAAGAARDASTSSASPSPKPTT